MPQATGRPEQNLINELLGFSQGKRPTSSEYLGHPLSPAVLSDDWASGNWPILAAANRYLSGQDNRGELLSFFAASEKLWMGHEENSPIYFGLHLWPIAAIHREALRRGDVELAAAALGWGAFAFWLLGELEAPDGQVLQVGMRGGGKPPATMTTWTRWVLAYARRNAEGRAKALAAGKALHLGMEQSLAWTLAPLLADSLASMSLASAGSPPASELAVPIHVLIWLDPAGTVVAKLAYLESHGPGAGNGNTPPLMALLWQAGAVSALPPGGGAHFREKFEAVKMILSAGRLEDDSSMQGASALVLPADPTVHRVIGDAAEPSVDPAPAPAPPAPSPVVSPAALTVELTALAARVYQLQLPTRQAAEKHLVSVAIAAAKPKDLAALADRVAAFGIGPAQPQAKTQADIVARLRVLGAGGTVAP